MTRFLLLGILAAATAGCSSEPSADESPMDQVLNLQNSVDAATADKPRPIEPVVPDPADQAIPMSSAVIPAAFYGEWQRRIEDCGDFESDTRLRIEPNRLLFYESVGTVLAVTGKTHSITVRARYEGEGESWESSRSFRLSPDGRTLRAEGMVRLRCP